MNIEAAPLKIRDKSQKARRGFCKPIVRLSRIDCREQSAFSMAEGICGKTADRIGTFRVDTP